MIIYEFSLNMNTFCIHMEPYNAEKKADYYELTLLDNAEKGAPIRIYDAQLEWVAGNNPRYVYLRENNFEKARDLILDSLKKDPNPKYRNIAKQIEDLLAQRHLDKLLETEELEGERE